MAGFAAIRKSNMILVNMGDYKVAIGNQKLITKDLGSCVGIAMRDPETEIGGLLHIMLPAATTFRLNGSANYAKYADTGLDEMVRKLVQMGASRRRLVVKLAGAAHMIKTEDVPESDDLSSRNLAAVKKKLGELNIPVLASEVGENYPRTVIFEPATGMMQIHTAKKEDRTI